MECGFVDDWISNDIQDIIDPDAINVIDYLEPPGGDFTQMAIKLTEINHALRSGIAFVLIQVRGDTHGVGGEGMKEKPQFYCIMKVENFPCFVANDVHGNDIYVEGVQKYKVE